MEQTIKYIQKKLTDVDNYIISSGISEANQIKFSNSKISTTQSWNYNSINIFITLNKKLATTSLKDFSKKSVDQTIKNLIVFAKSTKPTPEFNGIAKGPFKYKPVEGLYDPKITKLGDKVVDITEEAINIAHENKIERVGGVFETSTSKHKLVTSNGVNTEEKETSLYLSIRSICQKDATGHAVANSKTLSKFDFKKAAEYSAQVAVDSKNPEIGTAGKYDILFDPLSAANIINDFAEAFSIFSVEAGMSCLANKINKQVANTNITIKDDGKYPYGIGSRVYDDEGYPSQTTTVIDKGILKTYLHNTSTAKRYKVKNTGNAGIISPDSTNTVVENGDQTKEELISGVKKGIYITNLWYTRFQNYGTGDFSTIPRDGMFLIENGKIVKPLKNLRLSENMLNIMKNIKGIGKESEQIEGWEVGSPVIIPHILVKNLNITKPLE